MEYSALVSVEAVFACLLVIVPDKRHYLSLSLSLSFSLLLSDAHPPSKEAPPPPHAVARSFCNSLNAFALNILPFLFFLLALLPPPSTPTLPPPPPTPYLLLPLLTMLEPEA
jgi:hypothetical protein